MTDIATTAPLPDGAHSSAASEFISRVQDSMADAIVELSVFGSTIRGEADGRSSDVDVFIVIAEGGDNAAITDQLHEIAYDVMCRHGPLVELHILGESEFERHRKEGTPFVRTVISEGVSYA